MPASFHALIHFAMNDFRHTDGIECWCRPLLIPDPYLSSAEDIAEEQIRQEEINEKILMAHFGGLH